MAMNQITHVIFDMDGLLIDTERIYTAASEKLLAPFGHSFSWECKSKQMGRPLREAAKTLIDHYQLPLSVDEYIERTSILQKELMPSAEFLPGAEKLVRHLANNNIPICVATGSTREFYEIKTQRHRDVFDLFDHVLCSCDPELKRGKPHPDIFELAAARFPNPPAAMSSVLVFEDAPNGVEAALAAGAAVVLVPDPRVSAEVRARATLTLDSLTLFRPQDFGLPPFSES